MTSYHTTGLISAVLSTLAVAGVATQVRLLWQRWRDGTSAGQPPTSVLSINRFTTSFIIFFALYAYGGLLDPFNHYLVWPRVLAMLLVLTILLQIHVDRRCLTSGAAFFGSLGLFVASFIGIPLIRPIENLSPMVLPLLTVIVGVIYLQGGLIQLHAIQRARSTGGLSRAMHLLFVYKDLSLVAFALVMGLRTGWPILLTSSIGLSINLATLWCFNWMNSNVDLQPET